MDSFSGSSSLSEPPIAGSSLAAVLAVQLADYGYTNLEKRYFSEGGKSGSLPLLAGLPQSSLGRIMDIRQSLVNYIRSTKSGTVSSLRSLLSKTLRLKNHDINSISDDMLKTSYDKIKLPTEILLANEPLRDEMYCQLMKMIHDHRESLEANRAWQVMQALITMALPSTKLLLYLAKFIDEYKPDDDDVRRCLVRTIKNGQRYQPISYLEFLSLEQYSSIEIPIRLMNGTLNFIKVDSSTTSGEVIDQIGNKVKLRDYFGFSLLTSLDDKITTLGNYDKIFDSITRCELISREQNTPSLYIRQPRVADVDGSVRLINRIQNGCDTASDSNDASSISIKKGTASSSRKFDLYQVPWKFWIRKEVFSPWDDELLRDRVAIGLCYAQICRGHMTGEYGHVDGHAVSTFVAKRYFVDHGSDINETKLRPLLKSLVPKFWLGRKEADLNTWMVDIIRKHGDVVRAGFDSESVKSELILTAKKQWCSAFTKVFNGRHIETGSLALIGINSEGVKITSVAGEQTLMFFKFHEIQSMKRFGGEQNPLEARIGENPSVLQKLFIKSIIGKDVTFETHDAKEIELMLQFLIDGLEDRSEWAMVRQMEDACQGTPGNHGNYLCHRPGDLLRLAEPLQGETLLSDVRLYRNVESGDVGHAHLDDLFLIPTIERPDDEFINFLRGQMCKGEEVDTSL